MNLLILSILPTRLPLSHPVQGECETYGYGTAPFSDKIYRDFQVKGLLRPAARRFALLRKRYRNQPCRRRALAMHEASA
jgi:hypothetical protein